MNIKLVKYLNKISLILLTLLVSSSMLFGDLKNGTVSSLGKNNTLEFILYDANQIRSWVGNNGHIVSHIPTGNSGLEWPKGSGKSAIYASGLWIAGKVDGEVRSAAAEYSSEYQPGSMDYDPTTGVVGVANNPNLANFQVSSVNKNDSSNPNSSDYNREFATWPASDGAPSHDGEYFIDDNENGLYDLEEEFTDFNNDGLYNGPDGNFVTGDDPPMMIGDQMHWFVMNDADDAAHSNLWLTQPLNIEVQTTIFGFDRADPLGNIMFMKWLVINKSGKTIEDTYISIWSDADLGDANDDYVGCDTTLSVGYYYNGNPVDQVYGTTPPAVGYDFFQGPIVPSPGNTALVSGREIADFRNMPMTSFVKYINSNNEYGDPENAIEAYNYMQGLTATGDPWLDPEGNETKFLDPGDPRTGSGWTEFDDNVGGPDDRRKLMSSGPFEMETWSDTDGDGWPQVGEPGVQEIVAAIIIAAGTDNLNAVDAMKFFDQFAQNAYDSQFNLPSPASPTVLVSELDEQIILSWYENSEKIESFEQLGYTFQGYNVYQGESPNGPWKRIATFDKVDNVTTVLDREFNVNNGLILEGPVQFGTDSGVKRMLDIRTDAIRGNSDLINGRKYYFSVTNYAFNDESAPKTVESSKSPITIKPHTTGVGETLNAGTDDIIDAVHHGIGETIVNATVVDPLQLTGDAYKVGFNYDSTSAEGSWYFGRINASNEVTDTLIESTVLSSFETDMIDGLKVSVQDVAFEVSEFNAGWNQSSNILGNQLMSKQFLAISPGGVDSLFWNENGDTAHLDTMYGPDYFYDSFEIDDGIETYFNLIRAVSHEVYVQSFASDVGGTSHLAASIRGIGGGITDPELIQSDLQIRFTDEGSNASIWLPTRGYQISDTLTHVPYEIWDVERNVRLGVGIGDNNRSGSNSGMIIDGEDTTLTLDNDWIVTIHEDYAQNENTIYPLINNPSSGWLFVLSAASKYSIGDTVNLYFLNPVKAGVDEYIFSPEALKSTTDQDELQKQIDLINVFPNPYFGFNIEETSPLNRFVRFTHLPTDLATKCNIRIYSVGGQFVNKIEHHNSSFSGTTFDEWNLTNQAGVPVASGMYIIHVEVEGVGNKILKMAVFQPEERLDVY